MVLAANYDKLAAELRAAKAEGSANAREIESNLSRQAAQEQAELKKHVQEELERRTTVAAEKARAAALNEAAATQQRALTEAMIKAKDERDQALSLLKQEFSTRLQIELESAFTKGKIEGTNEARVSMAGQKISSKQDRKKIQHLKGLPRFFSPLFFFSRCSQE